MSSEAAKPPALMTDKQHRAMLRVTSVVPSELRDLDAHHTEPEVAERYLRKCISELITALATFDTQSPAAFDGERRALFPEAIRQTQERIALDVERLASLGATLTDTIGPVLYPDRYAPKFKQSPSGQTD